MNYYEIGLFFLLQLLNVFLSTLRSFLTIKGNKHSAAFANAISYTFYSAVVKLITSQDMVVVCAVTFITNIIGVYAARGILSVIRKNKLWIFNVTGKTKNVEISIITNMLDSANIKYVYNEVSPNKLYTIQIFSYLPQQSKMIKEILKNYDVKYYIVETK